MEYFCTLHINNQNIKKLDLVFPVQLFEPGSSADKFRYDGVRTTYEEQQITFSVASSSSAFLVDRVRDLTAPLENKYFYRSYKNSKGEQLAVWARLQARCLP